MICDWIDAIGKLSARNESYVLITLLAVRGSTPRDTDTKMVVSKHHQFDSIGGGNLEYQATKYARDLLANTASGKYIEEFSLGASLGQCCGGHTTVLFEHFAAKQLPVVLFGGGHVGSALATILADLPVQLHWLDSRTEWVDEHQNDALKICESPVDFIQDAPTDSVYLIMTHDHSLDFDTCKAILARAESQNDIAMCGVIGSNSKAAKFRNRLKHRGFSEQTVDLLQCPVGVNNVPGKRPMEVAVSIAAVVISLYHQQQDSSSGISRRDALKLVNLREIEDAI